MDPTGRTAIPIPGERIRAESGPTPRGRPPRGRGQPPTVPGLRGGPGGRPPARRAGRGPDRAPGRRSRPTRSPSAWRRATRPPAGVVLWTRLAPEPLEPGGGMPPENVEVRWEIAGDEAMKKVVRRGTAVATPQLGHSVHVEVEGLRARPLVLVPLPRRRRREPGRPHPHHARRRRAARRAPVRLRLVPALRARACITAYEHMAKDDLDLVVHLGDYIYEGPGRDGQVRKHAGRGDPIARRLPHPPRPVPDRPAPAGDARPLPVARDLGRPRGRQQLRRRRSPRRRASTRPTSWSGGRTPTRRTTR